MCAPEVPFPAASGRWEVAAGLAPLGDAPVIRRDSEDRRYRAAKARLLARNPAEVRGVAPAADRDVVAAALRAALGIVAAEWPEHVALRSEPAGVGSPGDGGPASGVVLGDLGVKLAGLDGDAAGAQARASGPEPADPVARRARRLLLGARHTGGVGRAGLELVLDAVALSVPDDLAVVVADGDGDRVAALSVAFPSGWRPAHVLGSSFAAVHAPIPHSDALVRASRGMVRALTGGRPLVRHVWGVPERGELCANPAILPPRDIRLDRLPITRRAWWRVERQVLWPLPAIGAGLFWIRTWCVPLSRIAADPANAAAIAQAVDGMDDAALAYKGLTDRAPALVAWLTGVAT